MTVTLDTPAVVAKLTEDEMLRYLWRHFAAGGWFPVPQVSTEDEEVVELDGGRSLAIKSLRRIDMLLVRKPRKDGIGPIETLAIEVKVSRDDWKRDLDNPGKQQAWRSVAHRHAYAVPAGMVTKDEVPNGSGLITVLPNGHGHARVDFALRAPYLGERFLLPSTVRTMFARLASLEAKTRGWFEFNREETDPAELRAALEAANKAAEKAVRALKKAEQDRDSWRTLYAKANGVPCCWCANPIKPLRPSKGWFASFRHFDAAHDDACREIERVHHDALAREAYDDADEHERARRMRSAEYAFHTWGARYHSTLEQLEAEPWRAYIAEQSTWTGPYPIDAPEEKQ